MRHRIGTIRGIRQRGVEKVRSERAMTRLDLTSIQIRELEQTQIHAKPCRNQPGVRDDRFVLGPRPRVTDPQPLCTRFLIPVYVPVLY